MTTDQELLRQFAEEGSEAAFAEVVHRQVDFVYSTARRLTAQDTHLAEDIAQRVFADMARKARVLSRHPALAGWLHHCTRFHAFATIRREQRRRAREQKVFAMQDLTVPPLEASWEQLCPMLDAAVDQLNPIDREMVLLRFFHGQSHREIGNALGLNENAANKRIERALEKLRAYFSRRGVKTTTAALAAVISANSVQAAPAGLAAKMAPTSLAQSGGPSLFAAALAGFLLMNTKIKVLLGVIVLLALILGLRLNWPSLSSPPPATEPSPVAAAPVKVAAPAAAPVQVMENTPAKPVPAASAMPVAASPASETASAIAVPLNADLQTAVPELIRLIKAQDYVDLVDYVIPPEVLAQKIKSGEFTSREDFATAVQRSMEAEGGGDFVIQGLTVVAMLQQNPAATIPGASVTVKTEDNRVTYAFETPLGHKDLVFVKDNGLWYAFQQ